MTPVAIPFQLSHCSAMPSCESNALVSTMFPAASGTLYSLPSVSTPSTSIKSRRICEANSITEEGTVVQFYEKSCWNTSSAAQLQMLLTTHPVSFPEQFFQFPIEIRRLLKAEIVDMIGRDQRFDAMETGQFHAALQPQRHLQPVLRGLDAGEAYADLKNDAGLLSIHVHRP